MFSKKYKIVFFVSVIHFLAGLAVASVSALLIYFKQKPVLHLTTVLLFAGVLYLINAWLRNRKIDISPVWRLSFLVLLILFSLLSPQLIYQIRPYTFYITGIILIIEFFIIVNTFFASLDIAQSRFWVFGLFVTGFTVGNLIPPINLIYLIPGLSMILVIYYLFQIKKNIIFKTLAVSIIVLSALVYRSYSVSIIFHPEQQDYEDKILFAGQTQNHKLVITQWHDDYWFFIDRLKNLSTIDAYLYYEPMVHSVFRIAGVNKKVLIIGGENGLLMHELLKYDDVLSADVISSDTILRNLADDLPYFTNLNKQVYKDERLKIVREDLFEFISDTTQKYDLIFIDLPDPRSIESNQYYTLEFYQFIRLMLNKGGVMITQAGSPYFATEAFYTIGNTLNRAGFCTLPLHNQILTLGEWGWFICSLDTDAKEMKNRLLQQKEISVQTKWFDEEAAKLISSFGKTYEDTITLQINSMDNPVVYRNYLKGNRDTE